MEHPGERRRLNFMMQQGSVKVGPVRGCLLPILGLIGFIALCYVFCMIMFTLGNPNSRQESGMLLQYVLSVV
jgi:hypothetical protein